MGTISQSQIGMNDSGDRHWMLGFLGLLSSMGFLAFHIGDPVWLFWFTFASFFSAFRYQWEPLRYLGLLGIVGLLVAIAGVLGVFTV
jgi:hypothetical protein